MEKRKNEKEIEHKEEKKNSQNKKVKKKKSRKLMKTVICLLSVMIILGCSLLGYRIYRNGGGVSGILATVLGEDEKTLENLKPLKLLVMGISGVDDYKLADTIMIAYYNPKTQYASLMSIPRDTYVGRQNRKTASQNYIASYKINTVFRNKTNIPEAVDRINDLTGLGLENYVIIDTDALIKLVDAIGGVTFNVPIDMDYDDTSQDLAIHLKAGEQLINGEKAEQLLRFRHNNNGTTYPTEYGQQDLGRMRTQREFIAATLKQTLKAQNIFKLRQILDIANENVDTNIDLATLKNYIPYAVNFDVDTLKTGVLPGSVEMCNGVSIYVANATQSKELINDLFVEKTATDEEENSEDNSEEKDSESTLKEENADAVTVQILNGTSTDSNLSEIVQKIKEAGYKVVKQGTTNVVEKTSIINRTDKQEDVINNLKTLLNTENVISGEEKNDIDVTIIIGKDYK